MRGNLDTLNFLTLNSPGDSWNIPHYEDAFFLAAENGHLPVAEFVVKKASSPIQQEIASQSKKILNLGRNVQRSILALLENNNCDYLTPMLQNFEENLLWGFTCGLDIISEKMPEKIEQIVVSNNSHVIDVALEKQYFDVI